jgi:hypothetical protein
VRRRPAGFLMTSRRKEVSDSLVLQYVGVFAVALGIFLSTLGNTVAC